MGLCRLGRDEGWNALAELWLLESGHSARLAERPFWTVPAPPAFTSTAIVTVPICKGCREIDLYCAQRNCVHWKYPVVLWSLRFEGELMTRTPSKAGATKKKTACPVRFESAKLEGLYPVLDGIAWMDAPSATQLAQFSGADARTVGKLLKNADQIGLVARRGAGYLLLSPYPFDGTALQKQHAVKDALLRFPLLVSVREFLKLGDTEANALRKAATVRNIIPFDPASFAPLIDWARKIGAIDTNILVEDVIDQAVAAKQMRHRDDKKSRIAFLSHSSHDKPFIRQLASDLKVNGVQVWLDELNIKVGESIPDKIGQGLAESDYFLFVASRNSVESEWVKRELNSALLSEVEKRAVSILPIKIEHCEIPLIIRDKKYADFSKSYKQGLTDLLHAMGGKAND